MYLYRYIIYILHHASVVICTGKRCFHPMVLTCSICHWSLLVDCSNIWLKPVSRCDIEVASAVMFLRYPEYLSLASFVHCACMWNFIHHSSVLPFYARVRGLWTFLGSHRRTMNDTSNQGIWLLVKCIWTMMKNKAWPHCVNWFRSEGSFKFSYRCDSRGIVASKLERCLWSTERDGWFDWTIFLTAIE